MAPAPAARTGILRRACPRCGQAALQRWAEPPAGPAPPRAGYGRLTRMHCSAEGCGFDGWVPRRAQRRPGSSRWRLGRRRLLALLRRWSATLGVLALVGAAASSGAAIGSAWERAHAPTAVEQRTALPPGEYHDGDPLPPAHPLARPQGTGSPSLDLRGACVWGRPGRHPYQGSVADALAAARVPAEVQAVLLAKHAQRQPDGRLVIANDGIRAESGGRVFAAQGFAMTYGHTLCLETRVNFPAGHAEPADLYEASDARGRRWSMMVPDVCGNVSFIAEAGDAGAGGSAGVLPAQFHLSTLDAFDPGGTHSVPLPGTLACVLAAFAAWAGVAVLRRRTPPGEGP